jgi:hypothetical protein
VLEAKRTNEGARELALRLGVQQCTVVAPWPQLWRSVERVVKPQVAEQESVVRPQSERSHGVAVNDAAALASANQRVIELR